MNNTVLITGGGHAELPLIKALHRLDYQVVSIGTNKDGLGHKEADIYIPADFSDQEAVLAVARNQNVCGIVSGCNDFAYLSTAYACSQLGLPGHDTPEKASEVHHKNRFREALRRSGLPHPAFRRCESAEEAAEAQKGLQLPIVVKPIDLTGGKGVAVCRDRTQIAKLAKEALSVSRRKAVLLEEFIEGSNHGVSALVQHEKVCFAFFDNEEYYLNPYLVSGAYGPSDLTAEVKGAVISQIERIFGSLGLCDGLFHCQCIVTATGRPYLIDPCRRAPGDLYVDLVSLSTGIDYPMAIVKSELGLSIEEELRFSPKARNIARECMMTDRNGVIRQFTMTPEYKAREISRLQWGHEGERIEDYMQYNAGIVFFEFESPNIMREMMGRLYENMQIEVDPQ